MNTVKSQNLSLLINNHFTNRLSFLNFTLTNKQHNMKKIYVLSLALSTALAGFSQFTNAKGELVKRKEFKESKVKPSNSNHTPKGLTLWSNEFDNSADWVLDNSCAYTGYNLVGGYDYVAGASTTAFSTCTGNGTVANDPNTSQPAQWVFETNPSVIPVGVLSPFASASAANGFLFINSDATGGGDGDGTPIFVTATIASPIDLTGEPSVVLSFSHNYRWWQDTRGVRVSPDNGSSWYQYEITNNAGYPNDQNSGNPEITSIDISSVAGNASQVLVQFYYEDNDFWAWYWAVDDVKISRKDQNNIVNNSSWIFGENSGGAEYGRTPVTHLPQNWYVGSQVTNDGVNDQTNVALNADFGSFSVNTSISVVESDSTRVVETLEPIALTVGVYNGTFTVSSDSDAVAGPNSADNVFQRNFEVTTDLYTLDGIGNHPSGTETLGSIGSNTWSDAADGLVCATMYPVLQNDVINNVRTYITSTSSAGAEVILYILDSIDMASWNYGAAYFTSDIYTLTQNDISLGYFDIPVVYQNSDGSWSHLDVMPGNYYAAVELFSSGNTFDVRIVDDATVPQPAWQSSIYYPNDQVYSNGNAFAIQLMLGANTSVSETVLEDVSIYPNPSNGVINIKTSSDLLNVNVFDISGKIVHSTTLNGNLSIDLSQLEKGSYIIELRNSTGIYKETITIQ